MCKILYIFIKCLLSSLNFNIPSLLLITYDKSMTLNIQIDIISTIIVITNHKFYATILSHKFKKKNT